MSLAPPSPKSPSADATPVTPASLLFLEHSRHIPQQFCTCCSLPRVFSLLHEVLIHKLPSQGNFPGSPPKIQLPSCPLILRSLPFFFSPLPMSLSEVLADLFIFQLPHQKMSSMKAEVFACFVDPILNAQYAAATSVCCILLSSHNSIHEPAICMNPRP